MDSAEGRLWVPIMPTTRVSDDRDSLTHIDMTNPVVINHVPECEIRLKRYGGRVGTRAFMWRYGSCIHGYTVVGPVHETDVMERARMRTISKLRVLTQRALGTV